MCFLSCGKYFLPDMLSIISLSSLSDLCKQCASDEGVCEQREVIRPSGIIQLNVNISGRRHKKANKLCLSPPPEGSCLLPCGSYSWEVKMNRKPRTRCGRSRFREVVLSSGSVRFCRMMKFISDPQLESALIWSFCATGISKDPPPHLFWLGYS